MSQTALSGGRATRPLYDDNTEESRLQVWYTQAIAAGIGTIFVSRIPNDGRFTFAFLEYARANALELWPRACWVYHSGIPATLALSDEA